MDFFDLVLELSLLVVQEVMLDVDVLVKNSDSLEEVKSWCSKLLVHLVHLLHEDLALMHVNSSKLQGNFKMFFVRVVLNPVVPSNVKEGVVKTYCVVLFIVVYSIPDHKLVGFEEDFVLHFQTQEAHVSLVEESELVLHPFLDPGVDVFVRVLESVHQ